MLQRSVLKRVVTRLVRDGSNYNVSYLKIYQYSIFLLELVERPAADNYVTFQQQNCCVNSMMKILPV